VRVLAATQADREAGRFLLAVSGCAQDADSTVGRFAGLRSFLRADSAGDNAVVAELVVQARTPQAAPLAPPAGLAPCRIPVGVPPHDGDLRLADLQVFSDGDRLIVWSARHIKAVIPVLYSRLSPAMLPAPARLLQLLGRSGCRPFQGWSWGRMRFHPFQPRVEYRQMVLSPARWLLPPDLTAAARERARWPQAVMSWRAETIPALPDIVVIEDGDRLLPLDLREDEDRELLRRYVGRGARAVTEQPGGPDAVQAVLASAEGDHVLELVLSLDRRMPAPAPQLPASPRPVGTGLYLPGSPWLSLAVRAPAHLHDQLAVSLGEAVESLPREIDRWFWLRYTDSSGPYLRARFHGDPAALGGEVLPALSVWCRLAIQEHMCRGFSIEPYDQEIERYGGPDAITAAEDIFTADSRLALAILRAAADPGQRMIAAAHCAATTALAVATTDPSAAIGRPRLDRAARHRYDLLRPQARAAWPAFPGDTPVTATAGPAWHAWRESLTGYRDRLGDARRASCASSLIHMSANRLLGNPADETIARALAADLLGRSAHPWVRA
jgi:thiopeptide-type bacteriocin biosynthesis protein